MSKKSQKKVFKEIRDTREHICVNCGVFIYEAKAINFSHIKPKGLYPELKYDPNNIEIVCSNCHCNHHWITFTDFIP